MSSQPFCNSGARSLLFALVDCTGATPGTFPSIHAALPSASAGTFIIVLAGPCNENLQLFDQTNRFLGTYYGFPNVAINGGINGQSHGVYLQRAESITSEDEGKGDETLGCDGQGNKQGLATCSGLGPDTPGLCRPPITGSERRPQCEA